MSASSRSLCWLLYFFALVWEVSSWLAFFILCVEPNEPRTVLTTQFHKWAMKKNRRELLVCCNARGSCSGQTTKVHHTHPFHMHYCITNGWLIGLEQDPIFRGLEATLRFLGIEYQTASDRITAPNPEVFNLHNNYPPPASPRQQQQ